MDSICTGQMRARCLIRMAYTYMHITFCLASMGVGWMLLDGGICFFFLFRSTSWREAEERRERDEWWDIANREVGLGWVGLNWVEDRPDDEHLKRGSANHRFKSQNHIKPIQVNKDIKHLYSCHAMPCHVRSPFP